MYGMNKIGVRIYDEWYEMIEPVLATKKGTRFIGDCIRYTMGITGAPDFSDDAELQELWEMTNAKPCDPATGKDGWLKVWKRRRRAIQC